MSGALVKSATIPAQPHGRRRARQFSLAQAVTKNMPQSEAQTPVGANGASSDLLDVAFIRLPEVKAVTGLSKTTIYELIRVKDFPAPVRLGPRVVAWVKSEVRQWAVGRVEASRSAA